MRKGMLLFPLALAFAFFALASTGCTREAGPERLVAPGALSPAAGDHFNEKFSGTFEVDDTLVRIEAGSKRTKKSQFTHCGYYTEDWTFLGDFQSDDFSSDDRGTVLAFCETHFEDRVS